MYIVSVTVHVKPQFVPQFVGAILDNARNTRAERGNVRFDVSQSEDDPGRFLAVSQLGLTVIGFFASAFAAVSLTDGLTDLMESAGVGEGTATGLALVIVTVVLALFTIIFAELVPKTLALANADLSTIPKFAAARSWLVANPAPRWEDQWKTHAAPLRTPRSATWAQTRRISGQTLPPATTQQPMC